MDTVEDTILKDNIAVCRRIMALVPENAAPSEPNGQPNLQLAQVKLMAEIAIALRDLKMSIDISSARYGL